MQGLVELGYAAWLAFWSSFQLADFGQLARCALALLVA